MKRLAAAGLVLFAMFIALMGEVNALANYPWCILGYHRGVDCYFSTRDAGAMRCRREKYGVWSQVHTKPILQSYTAFGSGCSKSS
jgi:hypothetical protein